MVDVPALVPTTDPPLATDSDAAFDAKAFPWAASLDPFGASVEAIAVSAQQNADAALAAALGGDLPSLTGKALQYLRVNAGETAAEFNDVLASPALTGTPTAPTPATGTDTTQLATTAYVVDEIPNQLNATGTAPIFACRAWGLINASSGTPVVSGSGNVASITDLGVGMFQVNFTTAMPSANYAIVGSSKDANDSATAQSDRTVLLPYSLSTTSFRIVVTEASTNTPTDAEIITFAVFG